MSAGDIGNRLESIKRYLEDIVRSLLKTYSSPVSQSLKLLRPAPKNFTSHGSFLANVVVNSCIFKWSRKKYLLGSFTKSRYTGSFTQSPTRVLLCFSQAPSWPPRMTAAPRSAVLRPGPGRRSKPSAGRSWNKIAPGRRNQMNSLQDAAPKIAFS